MQCSRAEARNPTHLFYRSVDLLIVVRLPHVRGSPAPVAPILRPLCDHPDHASARTPAPVPHHLLPSCAAVAEVCAKRASRRSRAGAGCLAHVAGHAWPKHAELSDHMRVRCRDAPTWAWVVPRCRRPVAPCQLPSRPEQCRQPTRVQGRCTGCAPWRQASSVSCSGASPVKNSPRPSGIPCQAGRCRRCPGSHSRGHAGWQRRRRAHARCWSQACH